MRFNENLMKSYIIEQDRTGQDKTGQERAGQDKTRQDRTGQDRTCLVPKVR